MISRFTALSLVLVLALFCSCASRQEAQRKIFLSTPLSGAKSKGLAISSAVKLFFRQELGEEFHLVLKDSQSSNELAASQVLSFLNEKGEKLVFGPAGSDPSRSLLELVSSLSLPLPADGFFLNQVTASNELSKWMPTISSFFHTSDYLRGVVSLLKKNKAKKPPKAHILRLANPSYFAEIAYALKEDLAREKIPLGLDFLVRPGAEDELKRMWHLAKPKKEDWIFILSYGDPAPFQSLSGDPVFSSAIKVITYGRLDVQPIEKRWFFNNSWSTLFWHPAFLYRDSSSFNNCQFVKNFKESFGAEPDFHAAFTYSLLQVMRAFHFQNPFLNGGPLTIPPLPSITGAIEWNSEGQRLRNFPILVHREKDKRVVYLPPVVEETCSEAESLGIIYRRWEDSPPYIERRSSSKGKAPRRIRFIPVELWSGSDWIGHKEPGFPKSDLSFGARKEKSIIGPLTWMHPVLGKKILVYKRYHSEQKKLQLFTVNSSGMGRVFDSREGGYYSWDEVKFPLGYWEQNETREFPHQRWFKNGKNSDRFISKIHILRLDFNWRGRENSLEYELEIRDSKKKVISKFRYVYSPGLGNVSVVDLLPGDS